MCLAGWEGDTESRYHVCIPLPALHCFFGCYEFPASHIPGFLTTQLGATTSVYVPGLIRSVSLIPDPLLF